MSTEEPTSDVEVDALIRQYLRRNASLRASYVREWKHEIGAAGQRRFESIGRLGAVTSLRKVIEDELTQAMRDARRRGVSVREIAGVTGLSKDHVHRRTRDQSAEKESDDDGQSQT